MTTPGQVTPAASLSKRQLQVASLLCAGETRKAIAEKLGISERVVRVHIERARQRLNTKTTLGLVAIYAVFHAWKNVQVSKRATPKPATPKAASRQKTRSGARSGK